MTAPPRLPFAALRRTAQFPPFSAGDLGEPAPVPRWEDYAPPPPGMLSGLVGGKARHARAVTDAQAAYQQAEIALVQAQANRYADTAALFQALGGGWWHRDDLKEAKND